MVLYIEYVTIDNFVVDFLLLRLLKFTFKENFSVRNMIFSCLFGTIAAICMPFIIKYHILLSIYKILTAMLMILILKRYKTYQKYFLYLIVFILYTFVFGGCAIAILNIFNIPYSVNGLLLYNCEFPVSSFIIIFGLGSWLFKKIILALNQQMKTNKYLYKIVLSDNGKKVEGVGFFDSGNTIERDGKSVNIISLDLFFKLYKDYSMDKLLFRNIDDKILKNPEYIDIKSIASASKYLSFRIDKMIVDNNEYEDVVVAVALKNFNNFDCIINSKQLGGVK